MLSREMEHWLLTTDLTVKSGEKRHVRIKSIDTKLPPFDKYFCL